jgi:hypothetical protein
MIGLFGAVTLVGSGIVTGLKMPLSKLRNLE